MKQTFTLYPSFSGFFSTSKPLKKSQQSQTEPSVSPWLLSNVMAYSAALFVAKTKNYGNYTLLMN